MNAKMVFGLIILVSLLWSTCNALRESAKHKALVHQASLLHFADSGAYDYVERYEAQIDRIAERYNISELKERSRQHVPEPRFLEWAQKNGLEIHESDGWTSVNIRLGLGGHLLSVPFFVFHGGFAFLMIGLAVYGIIFSS